MKTLLAGKGYRVVNSLNKAKYLLFEEARPALEIGLSNAIAGIF